MPQSCVVAFGLDFYTEILDLSYLLDTLHADPFYSRYKKLNEAISGVVEDFSLVSFATLNVQVLEIIIISGSLLSNIQEKSTTKLRFMSRASPNALVSLSFGPHMISIAFSLCCPLRSSFN